MIIYQDFEKSSAKLSFIQSAIAQHKASELYLTALEADEYDKQKNTMINNYVQIIFGIYGEPIEDFTASNNKIASNFFHRLNTQRNMYSLGNGVSFNQKEIRMNAEGLEYTVDVVKETLGKKFDNALREIAYKALIHGICFGYWSDDRLFRFPITEFVPIWDEFNGSLRAGIRFWRLEKNKPLNVVLYEEDGFTKFQEVDGKGLQVVTPKKGYIQIVAKAPNIPESVIGERNYSKLPIVPMYGNEYSQSTLVGMKQSIDSFDLIRSGFANDLTDCQQIYWIMENYGGMSDSDLAKFRDRLKIMHYAEMDTSGGGSLKPYTVDIPFEARSKYLEMIRNGMYEDFGALDVHVISAGATNDHIDAAYQALDEEADNFEFYVSEFVEQVLELIDIDDTPIYKRNRISNEKEQAEMIMIESPYLDDETILRKLPNISPEEVSQILQKTAGADRVDVVNEE